MTAARRLWHELLVIAPIALLLAIGVNARTYVDDFELETYSPQANARVAAYGPVMRVTESAFEGRSVHSISNDELEKVAQAWIDAHRAGELKPLPPAELTDNFRGGVKYQIAQAATVLTLAMTERASHAEQDGHYAEAARIALRAVQVAEVLRGSDLFTVGLFSGRQRVALKVLTRTASHLPPAEAQAALTTLEQLAAAERPLTDQILQARRQFVESSRKHGIERQPIEEAPALVNVQQMLEGKMLGTSAERQAVDRALDRLYLASAHAVTPDYISEARFAYRTKMDMITWRARAMEALRGAAASQKSVE